MVKINQDEAIRAISAIAYTLVKAGLKDTKEVVEKVNEIANSVDTLLDEYVNEELDNLERELNKEV